MCVWNWIIKYSKWFRNNWCNVLITMSPLLIAVAVLGYRYVVSVSQFNESSMGLLALMLAIVSIGFAIYTDRVSKEQLREIADCTRNPLTGIDAILSQIYDMFCGYEKATEGGRKNFDIWFLGFTLGLGFAHRVNFIEGEWEKRNKHPEDFVTFVQNLNNLLTRCISTARNRVRCYCLDHGSENDREVDNNCEIVQKFISSLGKKYGQEYEIVRDDNIKDTRNFHNDLRRIIVNNYGTVNTAEELPLFRIPLQIIITTVKKRSGKLGRAVIVFNIGESNIDTVPTNEVAGFYSESEYLCDMFMNYTISLDPSWKVIEVIKTRFKEQPRFKEVIKRIERPIRQMIDINNALNVLAEHVANSPVDKLDELEKTVGKAVQNNVADVILQRFHVVTDEIKQSIGQMSDLTTLVSLIECANDCNSLHEFEKWLEKQTRPSSSTA